MNDTRNPQDADYFVDAGGLILINDAAGDVVRAFRDAEKAYDRLQLAWAGAYLAGLFMRFGWLQSLTIELTASAEYNDEGGSYRSVSSKVADVVQMPHAELPAALLSDGNFDAMAAAEMLEADLDDNDLDLYTSVRPAYDDFGELVLALDRDSLPAAVDAQPVSGCKAYQALFPDQPAPTAVPAD